MYYQIPKRGKVLGGQDPGVVSVLPDPQDVVCPETRFSPVARTGYFSRTGGHPSPVTVSVVPDFGLYVTVCVYVSSNVPFRMYVKLSTVEVDGSSVCYREPSKTGPGTDVTSPWTLLVRTGARRV